MYIMYMYESQGTLLGGATRHRVTESSHQLSYPSFIWQARQAYQTSLRDVANIMHGQSPY